MKILKINYKKIGLAMALVSALLLGACNKQLENNLINDTYSDTFWKNEKDFTGAVLGTYGLFRKAMVTNQAFFAWGDTPIGILTTNEGTLHSDIYTGGSFRMNYREGGGLNWTNWYRVVNAANLIIKKLPEVSDDKFSAGTKSYILGEAYFMRALSYFYMTRVWGDLPLQTEPIETADQAVLKGRTSTEEILKLIIEDGQKASNLLTWEGVDDLGRRRANKAAALALLTHATAWQNDYAKTVTYADSLISRTDLFALQAKGNIRNVFKEAEAKENIFVFTNKDAENESAFYNTDYVNSFSAAVGFITVSSELKGVYVNMPFATPVYFVTNDKLEELYGKDEVGDSRKTDFFRKIGETKTNSLMKYSDIVNKNAATNSDPRVESNLVIFRLADMILLKAEALNALGRDGEALTTVNSIRARAGAKTLISSTGANLKKDILKERQRELIGEGHAYFDIVRNSWKTNNNNLFIQLTPWSMEPTRFAQKGYLFPIHNDILNSNRLISQNPYWMGRY
ncbi:MAG: RagB/SusD family nutrient uptake outer membrane protein [Sphingobacterium sp.]|jgi:hypothetical protein|nr:RagB/SusD family nutrient uptake outer membrane protein [Sphingobacterium sp.]